MWLFFKVLKQNSGQHTSYYTLQIVGKLDIWLSWSDLPAVHLEMLLAGSLLKNKTKHKVTGTTRLCQAWHQCTKERGGAEQIYTMHSSTVEHAKHPYTDTKKQPVLDKEEFEHKRLIDSGRLARRSKEGWCWLGPCGSQSSWKTSLRLKRLQWNILIQA